MSELKVPKKKYTKLVFLKKMLSNDFKDSCSSCKYSGRNYKEKTIKAELWLVDHCKHCIHSLTYRAMSEDKKEKCYWFSDNYKPLYEWDNMEEGENNGSND